MKKFIDYLILIIALLFMTSCVVSYRASDMDVANYTPPTYDYQITYSFNPFVPPNFYWNFMVVAPPYFSAEFGGPSDWWQVYWWPYPYWYGYPYYYSYYHPHQRYYNWYGYRYHPSFHHHYNHNRIYPHRYHTPTILHRHNFNPRRFPRPPLYNPRHIPRTINPKHRDNPKSITRRPSVINRSHRPNYNRHKR